MGILKNDAKFLFYSKRLGVSFEKTLTLGRLFLYAEKKDLEEYIAFFKNSGKGLNEVTFPDKYAEPLFSILGAKTIDSLDFSDYEGASMLHDMNKPVPDTLKNKFTVVLDGGTLEHVFNFPVAIKNCMEMLAVGGHYIGITPANNSYGHGFYQFSPELYYRVFAESNGFKIKLVATNIDGSDDWYETADPVAVKNRVELTNAAPTRLMIIAEKVKQTEIFKETPQQSDYSFSWEVSDAEARNVKLEKDSTAMFLYRKLPLFIRNFIRGTYKFFFKQKSTIVGIGVANPSYFKKIEVKRSE